MESEERQKVKNFPILGIMHRIKGFIFSIFYPIACEINYSNSKKTCPLALDIFFLGNICSTIISNVCHGNI